MSELKNDISQSMKDVPLSKVTTSDEERARVEANRNTPQENAMVDAHNAERNANQNAHWAKQEKKIAEDRKKIVMNKLSRAYLSELMGEGINDNVRELKMISDKISFVLLNMFSVEERRLYSRKSTSHFQVDNSFGEGDELDEMENKIFEALKSDKDIQNVLGAKVISDGERDYFIKKAIRAERSGVYESYLKNL